MFKSGQCKYHNRNLLNPKWRMLVHGIPAMLFNLGSFAAETAKKKSGFRLEYLLIVLR